ncbi:YnbE family lipoprotein [Limibaculum sp. FT325]|uniref:YnbE family lipoprotein n=1 Tax=Thermohalobaculum sediminis TaxID=2939436 RepID=UPI0020BD69C6|nr:YnbE family lipoprotein [Limibaculum sediminis]MCL5776213.1 YnbE family lipoprotein [Limibaculum sediminis]
MTAGRPISLLLACLATAACEPTVRVEAPKEPITINLNVKVDAEVRVKLEEQAEKDIRNAPEIF